MSREIIKLPTIRILDLSSIRKREEKSGTDGRKRAVRQDEQLLVISGGIDEIKKDSP